MLGMFGKRVMSENQLLNGYANGITPKTALKQEGTRWFMFSDFIPAHGKSLEQIKELGFLDIKYMTAKSKKEENMWQNICDSINDTRELSTPSYF